MGFHYITKLTSYLLFIVVGVVILPSQVAGQKINPGQGRSDSGSIRRHVKSSNGVMKSVASKRRIEDVTSRAVAVLSSGDPLPQLQSTRVSSQTQNHLSLNEAAALAFDNSPEARRIAWEIEKMNGQKLQQSRLVNPSFGTVANEIGNDGQAGQYGIYVQRNIVRNNRVVEIENAFHWKIKSLSHRYDFVQRRIGRQLGRLYVEYDFQRKMIALTSARIAEVNKIKDYAETLMKVGEIATLEFTRIEIELARQSQRRELFRGNLEKTRAGILSYLSSDLETVIPDFDLESQSDLLLKEPEPADVKSSSISHQMTLSFADHPQKIALLDELEQLKWLVRYARSKQQPDLQWQTSLNIDTASDDLFAGFQLNVPWLVNDRKIGSIKSAQADVQSKIEEVDQLVRALRRKQTKWLMQKNVAAASMRSIRQKVIPLTDRNLVNTTKVFRAGETGYLELRQALEVGYEVRENLLEALQDFLVGHIELESLVIE